MKNVFGWMLKKKWWLAGLVVICAIGGWLWNSKQQESKKVATVVPEYRDITQVLKVSGSVDAEEKVRLSFAAASKLTWLNAQEGDWVKKNQGLASVDSRTLRNQMEIAQNTHGIQFRAFENSLDSVEYYSDGGLTDKERRSAETAQLSLRNTALSVEAADISVKLSYMSSPISGIVTKIDQKNVGALMLPSNGIEIVNPSSVYFSAVIDEEDVSKIVASLSGTIRLDAFPDQEFPTTVKRIAFTPSMSESGGTGYSIWLAMPTDNSQMRYKLGMNGDAEIVLDKEQHVLSIPMDALIERDGVSYVEVLEQGKTMKRVVKTGISDDDYASITDGLSTNDNVVIPTK